MWNRAVRGDPTEKVIAKQRWKRKELGHALVWGREDSQWNGGEAMYLELNEQGASGEGGHSPGVLRAQRADQGYLEGLWLPCWGSRSHCGDSNDITYILNKWTKTTALTYHSCIFSSWGSQLQSRDSLSGHCTRVRGEFLHIVLWTHFK